MANVKINPIMSSDTSPSPYVASSNLSERPTNEYYKAFDGDTGTYFQLNVTDKANFPQILELDMGSLHLCSEFKITQFGSNFSYKDYVFEGSNDNSSWTTLTSGTFTDDNSQHDITFVNTTQYRYYRLNCSTSYITTDCAAIKELELWGTAGSPSASASLSPSRSASASGSASSSASASASASKSLSPSASQSPSSSVSSSLSPSSSVSSSLSQSASVSPSFSSSVSPSPSPGFEDFTRQQILVLPTNDNDLSTVYTAQEVIDVSTYNGVKVGQVGDLKYMIHQFKTFTEDIEDDPIVLCKGQSTLDATLSTIYLQIFNQSSGLWETLDSDNTTAENTDFRLAGDITDFTNYRDDQGLTSCRVWQLGI